MIYSAAHFLESPYEIPRQKQIDKRGADQYNKMRSPNKMFLA